MSFETSNSYWRLWVTISGPFRFQKRGTRLRLRPRPFRTSTFDEKNMLAFKTCSLISTIGRHWQVGWFTTNAACFLMNTYDTRNWQDIPKRTVRAIYIPWKKGTACTKIVLIWPRSLVGRETVHHIQRSWVRFPRGRGVRGVQNKKKLLFFEETFQCKFRCPQ